MNMRNETCVETQTSKVPTRVAFLFISILWLKLCNLRILYWTMLNKDLDYIAAQVTQVKLKGITSTKEVLKF